MPQVFWKVAIAGYIMDPAGPYRLSDPFGRLVAIRLDHKRADRRLLFLGAWNDSALHIAAHAREPAPPGLGLMLLAADITRTLGKRRTLLRAGLA